MRPRVFRREAFLVAGVTGSGDETAKVWEAFMKMNKLNPLTNTAGEEGYEIRIYPSEGRGEVHVGLAVKDAKVPAEYKVFSVPASTYAEFEIRPAMGYGSSNADMNKWLDENAGVYREALLDGNHYAIEVYDTRYKGDKDPDSIVGILIPITSAAASPESLV